MTAFSMIRRHGRDHAPGGCDPVPGLGGVTSLDAEGAGQIDGDITISEAGGITINQVGQDIAFSLQLVGGFLPPFKTGYWYGAQFAGAGNTVALGSGVMHTGPFWVPTDTTFDRIGFNGTGTGTNNVRLGIYADNGFGYPDALVLDAGTVANAAGERTITISQALTAGLYWIAMVSQGGSNTTSGFLTVKGGIVNSNVLSDYTLGAGGGGYRLTGVTGALPDPYGSTLLIINTASQMAPFLRAA